MRLFVSGSAPLLAETHREFEDAHRAPHPRALRHDRDEHEHLEPLRRRAPGRARSAFRCRASELKVTDPDTGRNCRRARSGMIEVRGPERLQGLLADAGEDRARSCARTASSSPATSGVIDADGYVTIVGRDKDLIISGGYNIYPKEIEVVLDEQPGVVESAVIGVPHPDFGESPLAVLVPEPGTRPDLDAIVARRRRRLWRASSSPAGSSWRTSCRATRWARCRRRSCATATATSLPADAASAPRIRAAHSPRRTSGAPSALAQTLQDRLTTGLRQWHRAAQSAANCAAPSARSRGASGSS